MAQPTPTYAAIATALAELDRADRARLAATIAYETAERAVFAAVGRAVGVGETGLDDDAIGDMPDVAIDALGSFLGERGVTTSISYREAMVRARDADWIAGRA